jgi:N-acyl-D-aspartate/D-glutamate deacylase
MTDLLVRNGTLVDGTGAPSRPGDVRVRDGRIVELGPALAPSGEPELDAGGALVTPGLIDPHTHYDIEMFWDPSLDPLPAYGMTTAIMGNCGLGIAPVRDDVRADIADLLCFIEELPVSLPEHAVPWSWHTWSEYRTAASGTPTAVSLFAYTAHNALRAFAMGHDAWRRAATADERALMAATLDDALRHGSLGLSSNWFDTDRNAELVPTRLADDAEIDLLLDVLGLHPHATLQVIARDRDERHHVLHKATGRGIRCLSLGDGTTSLTPEEEGIELWHLGGGNEPTMPSLGFESSIATAAVPAWHELVNGPADDKLPLLADPEWRARARHDWDHPRDEQNAFRAGTLHALILSDSDTGAGPLGVSLADLAAERSEHPSDVLADWVLANGVGSRYTKLSVTPAMDQETMDARTRHNFGDHHALMGGTDAGAHLNMFCGAGSNLYLLTHWVRERHDLTVEHAVHCMTQRNAAFFSLRDRGTLEVGKRGDLCVFALDEIELRPMTRVFDLPDGNWRFTRPPAGFRATVVAGTPTVLDGAPTGARPALLGDAAAASRP